MDLIKREEEEEVDRISNLPDSLIHHILSSLHIKHVAQTSVLSKRWSYIWITHPILEFQDSECSTSTSSESDDSECFTPTSSDTNTSSESDTNDFMDFVDGTLHRRHSGANIQRFAITCSQHLNEYRVNSWITSAVRHNVQQLSLCLDQKSDPMIITRSLFTCESLISLKLEIEPNVRIPNYISLPKLKCLVLDGVDFSDDDEYWNENLFSNCPVLEDFIIQRCTWFDIPNFCISAPALKNFKMDLWEDAREDSGLRGCALKVDAPNLESFYYDASIAKEYALTTFPSLVRAAVQFRFKPKREQRIGHGAAVSQFFRALANVKRLSVSDDTLQALSFADDLLEKLPTFHNTKELIIYEELTADKALVALLKATPNLESLVFNKSVPTDDEEEEDDVAGSDTDADAAEDDGSKDDAAGRDTDADASEGEYNHDSEDDDVVNDPECLFLHLKSVHFFDFTGNPMQMNWLKLILKNAKALQTMSISTYRNCISKREEKLMVEIRRLPRASTSCVFKFPRCWQAKLQNNHY